MNLYIEVLIVSSQIESTFYSGITVHSREVSSGSSTTLSCVVSDISQAVSVAWKDSGNLVTDGSGITANSGELMGSSQTATLHIQSAERNKTFTCEVQSRQFSGSQSATKTVDVFVYCEYEIVTSDQLYSNIKKFKLWSINGAIIPQYMFVSLYILH